MLIQCKEELFDQILPIMGKHEPFIVNEPGTGYINVFDKGWIFVSLNEAKYPDQTKKIYDLLFKCDDSFVVVMTGSCRLLQQKICEHEQYIFCRKLEEGYKITTAWTTYISF